MHPVGREDRYLGAVSARTEIQGQSFWVNVHTAEVDGRVICVGLDLRSFRDPTQDAEDHHQMATLMFIDAVVDGLPSHPPDDEAVKMRPLNDKFVEITSPVIRGLRVAEVVEAAQAPVRRLVAEIAQILQLNPHRNELGQALGRKLLPPERTKRGPKPLLDEAALRDVVAVSYRVGGRRPVLAVQQALLDSGLLGARVSIDQARKAVAAARARGFIAPAGNRDRSDGGAR